MKKIRQKIQTSVIAVLLGILIVTGHTLQAADFTGSLNPSVPAVIQNVHTYMLKVDKTPDYSSIWNVIGMTRSSLGSPDTYKKDFYNNTINTIIDNNWDLKTSRSSDYSKLILAMTAIGKDAQNIDGHNLFDKLADFAYVRKQGFNGPIWTLIALNSHPSYEMPEITGISEQTTEEGLVDYILSRELPAGGWTLSGNNPDTDITAMTLQALAPYYGMRLDVTLAVERALDWLSTAQMKSGGYGTLSNTGTVETSESAAQVMVALSALGIDPAKDDRFIKGGKWPMSRLFEYYLPEGGFMHVEKGGASNGGGAAGTLDGMATEQGLYATVAYQRMLDGKTALYDMSDISLSPGGAPDAPSTTASKSDTQKSGSTSSSTGSSTGTTALKGQTVKVKKLTLNYKQITLQAGKTRTLKLKISPSNATNKKVRWTSSNKKIATVTQKGKIKALKTGRANITVTARDGSKKKAICKVIVKKASSTKFSSGSSSSGKVKITDVSLNYKQISLAAGASRTISATVSPANASNKKLTWSSSNKSIATVSGSGQVTGKKAGTVTITAKAKDGSNKSGSCTVIVYGSGSSGSGSSSSSGSYSAAPNPNRQGTATSTAPASGNSGSAPAASSNGQAGAGSGTQSAGAAGNTTSNDGNSEASTQAGAWSFDGDAYVPESSDNVADTADDISTDLADVEDFTSDETELSSAEVSDDYSEKGSLPDWLYILLGFLIPGGLASAFMIPWKSVGDKLLLLAAFRKKGDQA